MAMSNRRLVFAALIVFWCVLFTATHIPGKTLARFPIKTSDLLAHFVAYFILTVLYRATFGRVDTSFRADAFRVSVVLITYAACDELLQIPIPGRYASWKDLAADTCGIILALVAVKGYHLLTRARPGARCEP